ncbi:glycoside hydrolase family 95 protein [Alkalibacterium sp. s-m-22]
MSLLYYINPAKSWNEGMPIGNGKLGAMLFGGPDEFHIQCNEDSLWHGCDRNRNPHVTFDTLSFIQQLIFNNQILDAQKEIQLSLTCVPEFQRIYEPAGTLSITSSVSKVYSDYERELDLSTALFSESYKLGKSQVTTTCFSSKPDNVIAYTLRSSSVLEDSYTLSIDRLRGSYSEMNDYSTEQASILGIRGQTANGGVHYAQILKVESDGQLTSRGQYITVSDFSELTIYIAAATSFRTEDPTAYCLDRLSKVGRSQWLEILDRHIEDYTRLYTSTSLELSQTSAIKPIPQLMEEAKHGHLDNYLTELMFNYGRYLLISSSRGDSLPANLQGIWNKDLQPAWDSKFTININTQMNYWIAEKGGLSECHLPLFEHLKRMYPKGVATAELMYGIKGFTAHHNTDIWGDTAPQDAYMPASYWPLGALWLSNHIWDHYIYTLDHRFLKEHFYLMEESLRFILDFMVESPEGYLVTCPSVSPENSFFTESGQEAYVSYGSTMDNQLVWEAIQNYKAAASLVEIDSALMNQAEATLKRLPPHRVGKDGQLLEWIKEYIEAEPGHRHFSHLYGVFPGHRIKNDSADIKRAAKKALENRLEHGGGHTGWSAAWLINLWAHFHEPAHFHDAIMKQLNESTLPNLLDNHPPFQIDGNFGFTSGVIEGLVHMYSDRLDLFPSLPDQWTDGKINGVRLPHCVSVTLSWKNHELESAVFSDVLPGNPKVYIKGHFVGNFNDIMKDDRFHIG